MPLAFAVFALLAAAPGRVTQIPPAQGLEAKLLADARDGRLDRMPLLEAALVASGVDEGDVPLAARRVRQALAPAIARAKQLPTPRARGDALLQALHETVLRRYQASATEIDGVIEGGEYNCLSSALLFVVAADGLLDAPRGMVSKRHAFARVSIDGKAIDVETTTPRGFGADRQKLMTPEYVRKIAGADASPAALLDDLKHPEELPVLSLVAAVYSNRAVGLVRAGDWQAAATALDRASRLASGALRKRTADWRASVLNNGAIELMEDGRHDDARALLTLALDGGDSALQPTLRRNLATVYLHLADRAFANKDYGATLAAIAEAQKRGAAEKEWRQLQTQANAALASIEGNASRCEAAKAKPNTPQGQRAATCLATLSRNLRVKHPRAALQHARRALALSARAGPHHEPDASRALFFALAENARLAHDQGRCDAVEALIGEALPHDEAVAGQDWSAAAVMASCWVKLGDRAFDRSDWRDASKHYQRARAHLPSDKGLRTNLARVDLNQALGFAKEGRCDDARPLARRAVRVDNSLKDKRAQLLEACASQRAKAAADREDWLGVVVELRRGLRDAPNSRALSDSLGAALHNAAVAFLARNNCEDARRLLPELRSHKRRAAIDAVTSTCRAGAPVAQAP